MAQAAPSPILGRWEGVFRPSDSDQVTMRFLDNGQVALVGTASGRVLVGLRMDYKLNPQPQPMHLDIKPTRDSGTVLTIAEVKGNTLRLQIQGTNPGNQRPTGFRDASQFQKVSDSAIVPITDLNDDRRLMQTLLRSALVYRVESDRFPTTLAQLGMNRAETQNYRYQLTSQNARWTLSARPKKAGLKSYIALLSPDLGAEQRNDPYSAIAILCESVRPAAIAPALPRVTPPNSDPSLPLIQCGSGSQPPSER
jgi:hypothetical protein